MSDLHIPDAASLEPSPEAADFRGESLRLLAEASVTFPTFGTYALSCFTSIVRPTKDRRRSPR